MKVNKGQEADSPIQIPARGWKQVALRVKDQLIEDKIDIVSAGVAFYFFMSLFPALVAIITIYGLVMDPSSVQDQMAQLTKVLPDQAHQLLTENLTKLTEQSGLSLGWGALLGILVTLWSANSGTKYLFEGVNIAYDEKNERSYLKTLGITMAFTLAGMVVGIFCASLVVGFPAVANSFGLPSTVESIITWSRWPILALIVMFSLSMIYKYAPVRSHAQFKWLNLGAVFAVIFWVAGSALFSFYVEKFGSFSESYGSVAAVIILMLWFNMTSFVILLGAEINAELEHQTARDTTTGQPKPLGERGAYHADHVAGESDEPDQEQGLAA